MISSFDELYSMFLMGTAKEFLESLSAKDLKSLAESCFIPTGNKAETIRNFRVRLQERKMLYEWNQSYTCYQY